MLNSPSRALLLIAALVLGVVLLGAWRWLVSPASQRSQELVRVEPVVPTATPRSIAEENALPGSTDWQISRPSLGGEIAAYTGAASIEAGDPLALFVSTSRAGTKYDATVYRMGWYRGLGARTLLRLEGLSGEAQGTWDPVHGLQGCRSCRVDPTTRLVEANWQPSAVIETKPDWVSGYYLVKLHEYAHDTESYAVFIVRNDGSPAPILVQASTNTWQAYNSWGDASLYGSFDADRHWRGKAARAYRVSYDRPYDPSINTTQNDGAGMFLTWEYNFVRWAESRGYDMTYTTNVDVALRPESVLAHRLFVSLGHDEYWTARERDAVERARDAGVNLAFFGGNEAYWQARLEASSAGRDGRVLTAYKDAKVDPVVKTDPAQATSLFAEAPVNRPESTLTGLAYGTNTIPDLQAWRAINTTSSWVFDGTRIRDGDQFPGIVGYEYDRMPAEQARPAHLVQLGSSPVNALLGHDVAASSIYTAAGGATVFDAGTIAWSWGLDDYGHEQRGKFADDRLRRLTANIIDRLSASPSMLTIPATH